MDNKENSVVVNNVVKNYGKKKNIVKALTGVSFEVSKGEVFGIIGPDGAGKTSLFRILTTLLLPDGGNATVDGLDRSEEHTSELQSHSDLVCRLLLEKKKAK